MNPYGFVKIQNEELTLFLTTFFLFIFFLPDDHSNPEEDPVYSDPLDALEKAEDTRIYNFPDFGDDEEEIEPIYEEAKAAQTKGLLRI